MEIVWLVATSWRLISKSFLLSVCSLNQQHQHHQGACYKRRISAPVPDLLNQSLQFDTIL